MNIRSVDRRAQQVGQSWCVCLKVKLLHREMNGLQACSSCCMKSSSAEDEGRDCLSFKYEIRRQVVAEMGNTLGKTLWVTNELQRRNSTKGTQSFYTLEEHSVKNGKHDFQPLNSHHCHQLGRTRHSSLPMALTHVKIMQRGARHCSQYEHACIRLTVFQS